MMTSKEIRQSFLRYFEKEGHVIAQSAPIVIKNDPTLMFTNAGMNQWKGIILGNEPIRDERVADIQTCLRVSGKHNDLEEVGKDTYHHTMFEMLGNWSFGNYFKEEAIRFAWTYIVDILHINPDDLYATVYEGSSHDGIAPDDEAAKIWRQFLPQDHILFGNKHDNFWEMGETGPCGPCSEIHVDCRNDEEKKAIPGASLINKDHPQVIEIWNLVFMQYNRKIDGSLETLPHKIIDTGMGFERLVRVVQNKQSNYDTDIFQPMLNCIAQLADKNFSALYNKSLHYGENEQVDIAMRVVADHIRTIAFTIADGQLPSNDKAGYVIRRILRRASRFAYSFLNQKDPFLYLLVPQLVRDMGEFYPQLVKQQDQITKIIKAEETVFLHTLEKGLKLLDEMIERAKKNNSATISGNDAFLLKDTYGFPFDLTELILQEKGMATNLTEFNEALEQQKNRARQANKQEIGDWTENEQYKDKSSIFVGYTENQCVTHIIKYRTVVNKGKTVFQVILTKTPLYAEMGGEVGDTGSLTDENNNVYPIIDTQKENGISVHLLEKMPQNIESTFTVSVDEQRRRAIERNHSATHILHYALRTVLGNHVEQKGSFVCDKYLRFDFSHFQKISSEDLRKIEILANDLIRQNIELEEKNDVPLEQAKAMGAMALFSEKYSNRVRVIKFGPSVELCGGCHVKNTGIIGSIRIINETSVATGIRRIEAVTANFADEVYYQQFDLIEGCKNMLKNAPNLAIAVKKLVEENEKLNQNLLQLKEDMAKQLKIKLLQQVQQIGDTQLIQLTGEFDNELIKNVSALLRDAFPEQPFAFVACTHQNEKPNISLIINKLLIEKGKNASVIVKKAAKFIQGGGGGQNNAASAGGKDIAGLSQALQSIIDDVTN